LCRTSMVSPSTEMTEGGILFDSYIVVDL
jgi:hypothetical protein